VRYGSLNNCIITSNWAVQAGGGLYLGRATNCVLIGNSTSAMGSGGGADWGSLVNCLIFGNSSRYVGGAYGCDWLEGCTIVSNSATWQVGGAGYCSASVNCILYHNSAPQDPNYSASSPLANCCTTPLPSSGAGNLTNPPLFIDLFGGNLRLQSNSPSINAGGLSNVTVVTDLDGRARVKGGAVDMGAYEFLARGLGEFTGWLQQYRLPTDGSADYSDSDGDGMNNWNEWRCGTDPTNPLSNLRLLAVEGLSSGVRLTWSRVANRSYLVQRASGVGQPTAFTTVATNFGSQTDMASFTDTNVSGPGPFFYRVGLQ
jgi:hypothetical protein